MLLSRFVVSTISIGLMVLGASVASGQAYPNKPVRIFTSGAGGGSDFVARIVALGISGPLGQPVIVDNRTTIGASEFVSKAPPDGYSLLVAGSSVWIIPLLEKMPYDINNLSPITVVTKEISVIAVHPSVPAKSVKELIALAKAKPGELNYATGSIGGPQHLGMELFKSMAGVDIVRVYYKTNAQAITGLISGEVHVMVNDAGLLIPYVKSGKLRALAVTSAEPTVLVPGLPSVAASGLPGFEAVGMTVIMAPVNTPAAIINRLNQDTVRFLNRADVKEKFLNAGAEVVGNSPEQLAAIIKTDTVRANKVIKDASMNAR